MVSSEPLLLLTCKVSTVPDVVLVSPDERPELQHDLHVLLEGLAGPAGIHLVSAEEVETAGVDPLSEDMLGKRLGHYISLEKRHATIEEPEPAACSPHVTRHGGFGLTNLEYEDSNTSRSV